MRIVAATVLGFLGVSFAAPTESSTFEKRATVIADGKSVHEGNLPDWNFKYHAAGYLAKGCPKGIKISTCYVYTLSSNPSENVEKDPYGVPIQDVLLNAPSHPVDQRIRQYTFRMLVDPSLTSTSSNSLPLVEIVSPDESGNPVSAVYLDVRDNQAGIFAFTDTSTPSVSIPLGRFTGKSTFQTWTLKPGQNGWANIKIIDEGTGATLLKYNATGPNSQNTYYMRVGANRATENGLKPLKVYWGDWVGKYI